MIAPVGSGSDGMGFSMKPTFPIPFMTNAFIVCTGVLVPVGVLIVVVMADPP
jgi:hypothetical protein